VENCYYSTSRTGALNAVIAVRELVCANCHDVAVIGCGCTIYVISSEVAGSKSCPSSTNTGADVATESSGNIEILSSSRL
jgi:hypothetical protein